MITPENQFINLCLDVSHAISRTIDFTEHYYLDKYVNLDTDLRHTLRMLLSQEINVKEFISVINALSNKFKLIENDELNLDNIF